VVERTIPFDLLFRAFERLHTQRRRQKLYQGDHYWADVYDLSPERGCRAGRGELRTWWQNWSLRDEHWEFVSFHYPDPDPAHANWVHDLLSVLSYRYKRNESLADGKSNS